MLIASGVLVALSLVAEPQAEPAAESSSGSVPTLEVSGDYDESVVGVVIGDRLEWTTGRQRERVLAVRLSIDAYHRERPLAFRVVAEASANDVLAEGGGKILAPALGPARGYAALCVGGAIRSGIGMVSASAAIGVEVRLGAWGMLTVEAEARRELDAREEVDAGQGAPASGHLGLLAGFAIPFD
jgi:hypothetical protein